ncbi:elongator complex protein 3 [Desulfobaculum sp. SPO524]|uniref:elongator complex protein 3 n=1 Tax=Desulfobaculum sp. SPO524 TaxID=3378071 RepID=UPI0038519D8B
MSHRTAPPFSHPAPQASRTRIWPVFLPFAGCPFRCTYCAQNTLTGQAQSPLHTLYDNLAAGLNRALKKKTKSLELAFFGGTFTALPEPWPERFLGLAREFRDAGLITRVRCSTRPDCITKSMLARLKALGLDMVELGIQSFDAASLAASQRGYTPQVAQNACRMVTDAGLALGVQLMPGLPGNTPDAFGRDIDVACALRPEVARLYPCVVLRDTPLAATWRDGGYSPWPLETTVAALGAGLLRLWEHGVHVIRIGLAPEHDLHSAILDGPWHPAMGQLVRSEALFHAIAARVAAMTPPPNRLTCPERFRSDLLGHKGRMTERYAAIGLPRDAITFHGGDTFRLESAPSPSA